MRIIYTKLHGNDNSYIVGDGGLFGSLGNAPTTCADGDTFTGDGPVAADAVTYTANEDGSVSQS